MSDLVERLRDTYENWGLGSKGPAILTEAAAEITRLQKELETAREALELVCKAVEREPIAGDLDYPHGHNDWLGWRKKIMRPAAAHAREVLSGTKDTDVTNGLSPWQGWDQSRTFWSETKHKDAVCHAVFGPTWSMEDAHVLISFIERTWGRALKDKEVAG